MRSLPNGEHQIIKKPTTAKILPGGRISDCQKNYGWHRRARKPSDSTSKIGEPLRGGKRGEAPVRRFSCDFACKIASLHEHTAGRAACIREALAPTSESKCLHLPSVASAGLAPVMAERPVRECKSSKKWRENCQGTSYPATRKDVHPVICRMHVYLYVPV